MTAVYLCCTFPEVAFGGRYPLSLPCGARTFLTGGLSTVPRGCPTCSLFIFYDIYMDMSNNICVRFYICQFMFENSRLLVYNYKLV